MANNFLPEGYTIPKDEKFLRFKTNGIHKFRILSPLIMGWEDWKDKKPLRYRMDNKPLRPIDPKKPIKHFWAMKVYGYEAKRIQVLEITQASIQADIQRYSQKEEYGDPVDYDFEVDRIDQSGKISYRTAALPPKPASDEIQKADCSTPVNLDALYDGKDPFDVGDNTDFPG